MINNELKAITATKYTDGVDNYGQPQTVVESTTTIQGMYKVYSQPQVSNPKYNEVELVLLTKATLDSTYQLTIDNKQYGVVEFISTPHLNRVLLKRYV